MDHFYLIANMTKDPGLKTARMIQEFLEIIANVLGMGVALITITCGMRAFSVSPFPPAFRENASRCLTPNRCCSSVITNASFA